MQPEPPSPPLPTEGETEEGEEIATPAADIVTGDIVTTETTGDENVEVEDQPEAVEESGNTAVCCLL